MGAGGKGVATSDEARSRPLVRVGHAADGTRIKETLRSLPKELDSGEPLLVGIRGRWYDVRNFVSRHPGGDVILEFVGRDATAQFVAYHSEKVLKGWKPVGVYDFDESKPGGDAFEGEFLALAAQYEKEGLFETQYAFLLSRLGIAFGMLALALGCVWLIVARDSLLAFVVGPFGLAGFWQQSGFLMHDLMHNHHFHKRRLDQRLGWFFGSVCFGVSSTWWRDEHNEHHLFTNTVIPGVGRSDPQMGETIWAQDPMLFDFFWRPLLRVLLRVQHIYFLPVLIFIGPFGIKVDAVLSESRPSEFVGMALHWAWVSALVSAFPTWRLGLLFYACASVLVGVLSVQLLVSHYAKPFATKDAVKTAGSWARRQINSVIDITCEPWLDWFHGGLNLHSPHHLFPRMCRCHYRRVHAELLDVCAKHGITLDVLPWSRAVAKTVTHLRDLNHFASMDPR